MTRPPTPPSPHAHAPAPVGQRPSSSQGSSNSLFLDATTRASGMLTREPSPLPPTGLCLSLESSSSSPSLSSSVPHHRSPLLQSQLQPPNLHYEDDDQDEGNSASMDLSTSQLDVQVLDAIKRSGVVANRDGDDDGEELTKKWLNSERAVILDVDDDLDGADVGEVSFFKESGGHSMGQDAQDTASVSSSSSSSSSTLPGKPLPPNPLPSTSSTMATTSTTTSTSTTSSSTPERKRDSQILLLQSLSRPPGLPLPPPPTGPASVASLIKRFNSLSAATTTTSAPAPAPTTTITTTARTTTCGLRSAKSTSSPRKVFRLFDRDMDTSATRTGTSTWKIVEVTSNASHTPNTSNTSHTSHTSNTSNTSDNSGGTTVEPGQGQGPGGMRGRMSLDTHSTHRPSTAGSSATMTASAMPKAGRPGFGLSPSSRRELEQLDEGMGIGTGTGTNTGVGGWMRSRSRSRSPYYHLNPTMDLSAVGSKDLTADTTANPPPKSSGKAKETTMNLLGAFGQALPLLPPSSYDGSPPDRRPSESTSTSESMSLSLSPSPSPGQGPNPSHNQTSNSTTPHTTTEISISISIEAPPAPAPQALPASTGTSTLAKPGKYFGWIWGYTVQVVRIIVYVILAVTGFGVLVVLMATPRGAFATRQRKGRKVTRRWRDEI